MAHAVDWPMTQRRGDLMQFGIVLPNLGPLATTESMVAIAQHAESLGFADLWTSDHLVLPIESESSYPYVRAANVRLDPHYPVIDPMIALAGLATCTTRIGLGVSVYLAALRNPIVAAKLVASLDQLSGGRVRLGVGAGWIREEYETFGIDFSERGRVLDEHLACMRTLWTEPEPRFHGQYFQVENIGFEPKPVQARLPIWVGGNSAAARARAARLGDGWHVIDVPLPELERGIEDLRKRCHDAGRDPGDVIVSVRSQVAVLPQSPADEERFAPLIGTREEIVRDLRRMRELGVGHVALWPAGQQHSLESYMAEISRFANELLPDLTSQFGARP